MKVNKNIIYHSSKRNATAASFTKVHLKYWTVYHQQNIQPSHTSPYCPWSDFKYNSESETRSILNVALNPRIYTLHKYLMMVDL